MNSDQKSTLLDTVDIDTLPVVDEEHVKSLQKENTIVAFCKTCGSYHRLAFKEAEEVFLFLKEPLVFENRYLVFGSCPVCKAQDKTVEIKNIQ